MSVGQKSAKDLRYLDNEDKFLDFAFEVLSRHFKDRSHFESFFDLIPTNEEIVIARDTIHCIEEKRGSAGA